MTERPVHRQVRRPWLSGLLLDRNGEPVSRSVWSDLLVDTDYQTVARDRVGRFHVVTMWRGTDPHVFETRVIREGPEPLCLRQESYTSEPEALAGHARNLSLVRMATFWRTAGGVLTASAVLVAIAAACSALAG